MDIAIMASCGSHGFATAMHRASPATGARNRTRDDLVVRVKAELQPESKEWRDIARRAHHPGKDSARILAHACAGAVVGEIALPNVFPEIGLLGQHGEDERGAHAGLCLCFLRICERIAELNRGGIAQWEESGTYRRGLRLPVCEDFFILNFLIGGYREELLLLRLVACNSLLLRLHLILRIGRLILFRR